MTTGLLVSSWIFHQYLVTGVPKMFWGAELWLSCAIQYDRGGRYTNTKDMEFWPKVQEDWEDGTLQGKIRAYDVIWDESLDVVKEDPGYIIILCFPYKEEWLKYFLEVPHMTVAGDAMPGTDIDSKILVADAPFTDDVGHPRTAGSHAASFRLGRQYNVPLMQTISQNSYWTALHLGEAQPLTIASQGFCGFFVSEVCS